MKKTIAILLALLLLLTGCAAKQESGARTRETAASPSAPETESPETEVPETAEVPETTAPKTIPVKVMGDGIPVVLCLLERGGSARVTGYEGDYAQVTVPQGSGLVTASMLRFPDEPFTPWTGYARWNTGLYAAYTCLGEPLEILSTNTQVEVLEELDGGYAVQLEGKTGFVLKNQLGKTPYVPQPDSGSTEPSGDSGSSGSTGGPQDGGDITLRVPGGLTLLSAVEKTGDVTAKADGTPVILRFCALGESVDVLEPGTAPELSGYTAILESDGTYAYIPTDWLENTRDFTPWEGYAGYNCKLYDNETLSGKEINTVYANRKLTVLWDTGAVSFVQVENDRYYALSSTLRTTPQTATAPAQTPGDSGGSSSGSNSGGSGGSSDLWTPPQL